MSTKDRLKIFIEHSNLTVSAFEKQLKLSNGYVNSISKGIGSDKLELMLEKFPNLNIEWLLMGTGQMLKKKLYNSAFKEEEISVVNEFSSLYGIDFKDLYFDAKYTIEIQKKYIVKLEQTSEVHPDKRSAG